MHEIPKKVMTGNGPFDVTRKFLLAAAAPPEQWQAAVQRLIAMEPILDACVDQRGRLHIAYDASCIGIRDIEPLLDEMGVDRASDFWSRLKLSWYRFLDENAKSNATSGSGACCNRPPSAYSRSRDVGKVR